MIPILFFISWCVAIAHFAMKQEREADAEITKSLIDQARSDGYEMGKLVPEVVSIPFIRFDPDIHVETIAAKTRAMRYDNSFPESALHRELAKEIVKQIVSLKHFEIRKDDELHFDFIQYEMVVGVISGEDIIRVLK